MPRTDYLKDKKRLLLPILFFLYLGLVLMVCFHEPIGQSVDYRAFMKFWSATLKWNDPWLKADGSINGNAYGPLFNVLSMLYAVHHFLPRAFFALIWFITGTWIYKRIDPKSNAYRSQLIFLVAFIFLNPFFLVTVIYCGQFDILIAALCLRSVIESKRGNDRLAGILLAIAVMLKVYPIVLAPVLALKNRKVNREFLYGFGAVAISVVAFSYIVWGDSVLVPVTFASGRASQGVSIFLFLKSTYSPLAGGAGLDWLSLPSIAAALIILLVFYVKEEIDPLIASILFLMVTLTFYKVGNVQFYTTLFFLISFWFVTDPHLSQNCLKLKCVAILPLLFVSLCMVIGLILGGYGGNFGLWALATFVLSLLSTVYIFRYALEQRYHQRVKTNVYS